MNKLLIISVDSPLLAGIYKKSNKQNILVKSWEYVGHTGMALHLLFSEIFSGNMDIDSIYYAKGPGRFSALRSTHIYLQTLHEVRDYKLFSTDSFHFNNNQPIRAFGNQYFYKENGNILVKIVSSKNEAKDVEVLNSFYLPDILEEKNFNQDNKPLYVLKALN